MNNLIIQNNESLTMSSREIASLVGSRHRDIMRSIDRLVEKGVISGYAPLPYTLESNNQTYYEYQIKKRDTYIVVAQNCPEFTAVLVDRWQELENKPVHQIPQTLSQALMLAANQAEQIEKQEEALKLAAPKVEFVDRFVESTGNKTFREVAKLLKANEREFRAFLVESQVMYKLNRTWTARAQHLNAGRFSEGSGQKNGRAFFECKFTPKGVEYIAGKWISHKEVK